VGPANRPAGFLPDQYILLSTLVFFLFLLIFRISDILTSLSGLVQLGTYSLAYEGEMCFQLCKLAKNDIFFCFIENSYKDFQKYTGIKNLIESHLDYVLRAWVDEVKKKKHIFFLCHSVCVCFFFLT
jgi:hypothetical protein